MTKNHGLLFRQYVPSLVACLEDADSAVRDTARLVVVELFRYGEYHAMMFIITLTFRPGMRQPEPSPTYKNSSWLVA